jgi:hypothetical protein
LRQHTTRSGPEQGSIRSEDLFHTEAPLRSGQVTPDAIEIEDEHVSRPTKYRTGVLGTLLRANTAAQMSHSEGRHSSKPSHLRDLSASTLWGASTAASSPNPSPPASGTSTPRSGRLWFNRLQPSQSSTSISQLAGSSAHSLATPVQRELGQEFSEQYKKSSSRPGMGKRSKSDESILPFKKAKRREEAIRIRIHL